MRRARKAARSRWSRAWLRSCGTSSSPAEDESTASSRCSATSTASSSPRSACATEVRGSRQVPGLAVAPGLGAVGHLPDHGLHEPVLPALGAEPVDLQRHDLLAHQRAQHRVEGGVVAPQRHQAVPGERRAEHAGIGDDPLLLDGERVEAGRDQRLQRGRCADGREVQVRAVRGHVLAAAGDDEVPVDQGSHRLHGEQRDALRPLDQRGPRAGGQSDHQAVDEVGHRGVVQRLQPYDGRTPAAEVRPSAEQLGTSDREHEDRGPRGGQQVVEEVEQPVVGVLGVVDHQDDDAAVALRGARGRPSRRRTCPPGRRWRRTPHRAGPRAGVGATHARPGRPRTRPARRRGARAPPRRCPTRPARTGPGSPR